MHQVGYLQGSYKDARSIKYKIIKRVRSDCIKEEKIERQIAQIG